MSWDNQILLFAAAHRTESLDAFFRGITWLGSLYVLVPLSLLLAAGLLYFEKQGEAWLLAAGLGGATVWVHPVSYTHLDVYKRQVLVGGIAIGTLFTLVFVPTLYMLIAKDHARDRAAVERAAALASA